MEITKLTTQARNPNRINLYVDGKFYRGLDKIVAIQLGLRPGLTLTSTLIQRLEKHQYANSECGIYSMLFLIKSTHTPFNQITQDIIMDERANQYRDILFRRSRK